jgi:hypothetical protein
MWKKKEAANVIKGLGSLDQCSHKGKREYREKKYDDRNRRWSNATVIRGP